MRSILVNAVLLLMSITLSTYGSDEDDKLIKLIKQENKLPRKISDAEIAALSKILTINISEVDALIFNEKSIKGYLLRNGAIKGFIVPAIEDISRYIKYGDILSANILSTAIGTINPEIGTLLQNQYHLSGGISSFISFSNRFTEFSIADSEYGSYRDRGGQIGFSNRFRKFFFSDLEDGSNFSGGGSSSNNARRLHSIFEEVKSITRSCAAGCHKEASKKGNCI